MSTFVYAKLTNKREEAAPTTSTTTASPGLKSYIDAFAALVPEEVLTLHAFIVAATTKTIPAGTGASMAAGSASAVQSSGTQATSTTSILPDGVQPLENSFWILIVLSIVLFVVGRLSGGKWDRFDFLRAAIAPLAFVGWTMLQRATAFDAAFPHVNEVDRTVYAVILAVVLAAVTAFLASKADKKTVQT